MAKGTITPEDALERLFDVIRDWAGKPENAHHMISVLGMSVEYPKADPKLINPHVLVKTRTEEDFYSIFAAMKPAEITKIMILNRLGVKEDFTGMKAPELLEELYERAKAKAEETNIR